MYSSRHIFGDIGWCGSSECVDYLNLFLILVAIRCPADSLMSIPNGIILVSALVSPFSNSNPSRRLFLKVNPSSCLNVLYLDLCCNGLIIAEAGIGG